MASIVNRLVRYVVFAFFITTTMSCSTFTEPVYKSESFDKKQEKLHSNLPDLSSFKMYRLKSPHNYKCPETPFRDERLGVFLVHVIGFYYTNIECTVSVVSGTPSDYITIADGAFEYQFYYNSVPLFIIGISAGGVGILPFYYSLVAAPLILSGVDGLSSFADVSYENRLNKIEIYKYPVLEEGLPPNYEEELTDIYVFTPTKALVQIYPYLPLDKRKLLYKNEALFAYYEFKGRICDTDEIQLNVSRPHRPIALAACSPNS